MARHECEVNTALLKEIMSYNFAILETVLYLNTHPEDRAVLKLHNKYAKRYMELLEEYQETYGPLYSDYPDADFPWRWVNDPWPWEIEY
ncbi:MAG: spore coat protein CotJB [Bacillota bacterium]